MNWHPPPSARNSFSTRPQFPWIKNNMAACHAAFRIHIMYWPFQVAMRVDWTKYVKSILSWYRKWCVWPHSVKRTDLKNCKSSLDQWIKMFHQEQSYQLIKDGKDATEFITYSLQCLQPTCYSNNCWTPIISLFCLWQCCFHLFARVLSDILMFLWKSYLIWFHIMDLNMKQWLWNMQCETNTLETVWRCLYPLIIMKLWMFIVIYVGLYLVKPRNSEKYLLENCIWKHHQISVLNIKYSILYSFNIICITIIIELNNISLTIIIIKCFFK